MDGMNKEKWNAMTGKQKREHIWEYYKIPILGVVFAVFFVSWFIYERSKYVEPVMKVVMTDVVEIQDDDSCYHDFLKSYGYEVYAGAVQMNQNMYFVLDSNNFDHIEMNGTNYNTLFGIFALADHEILFSQPDVFASCAVEGAMMDLSKVLPEELLEKHKDRLLYSDNGGEVAAYPCGVNVEGNPWVTEHNLYKKGYVGIMNTTDNPELAADFVEYFLNQFDKLEG